MPAAPARGRKSADERRDEIVAAAIRHFALSGYRATSTEAVARDAGISQPYLFRLFKTKRELFLACYDRNHERIRDTFRASVDGLPEGEERLPAMGKAYIGLLADRHALLFQMQSYAACADPEIQDHVRRRYGELVEEVGRLSGGEPHEVWSFFAHGMLLNVVASLDLEAVAGDHEWAAAWTTPLELIERAAAAPSADSG